MLVQNIVQRLTVRSSICDNSEKKCLHQPLDVVVDPGGQNLKKRGSLGTVLCSAYYHNDTTNKNISKLRSPLSRQPNYTKRNSCITTMRCLSSHQLYCQRTRLPASTWSRNSTFLYKMKIQCRSDFLFNQLFGRPKPPA